MLQSLTPRAPRQGPLLIVVEASAATARVLPHLRTLEDTLAARDTEVHALLVHGNGTDYKRFAHGRGGLVAFFHQRPYTGVAHATAGLHLAWQIAQQHTIANVLWVSGNQPVPRGDVDAVVQKLTRDPEPDRWLAVPMGVDHVLFDRLLAKGAILAHPGGGSLVRAIEPWLAPGPKRRFVAEKAPPENGHRTSDHLVRLWAQQVVLASVEDSPDVAGQLAADYRIVTPVSGAVVLELREQYEAHGLDPDAPSAVGRPAPGEPIPEPETWLLMVMGAIALALYGRRRRVGVVPAA